MLRILISGICAGTCIAIGGTAFLAVDSVPLGALLFCVGLFTVCTFGFHLYTGKVCYLADVKAIPVIWFGNLIGTSLTAILMNLTPYGAKVAERVQGMADKKLAEPWYVVLILAFFCNIMIYIAVDGYKENPHEVGKYLALVFGVVVFILCGFEHCVANMFYLSLANAWSVKAVIFLLINTVGNAAGGIFAHRIKCYVQNRKA